MAEFLLLFRGGNSRNAQLSPEQMQQHMQLWATWMGDLGKQGKMLGAQPLEATGKQVAGTKKVVTDGPYMEGKEIVGGYLLCKADSYEEAVAISKNCPVLAFEDGVVEVREVREMQM